MIVNCYKEESEHLQTTNANDGVWRQLGFK